MVYQYEPKGVCSMQMNIEVEDEIIKSVQIIGGCAGNTKINEEKINQSLSMKISELASLDTIQDVANENGLVYTNGNIVVVTNK